MAGVKQFTDSDTQALERRTFGMNATATHYLKKAKDAGDRLKINIAAEKPLAIAFEAATVLDNLNKAYAMIADENNRLETADSQKAAS